MININELRWTALNQINLSYQHIKNHINRKYSLEIGEENFEDFLENLSTKYPTVKEDEVLFELEQFAYRKLEIFSIKEKHVEELTNEVFKQEFIKRNRIGAAVFKECLVGLSESYRITHIKFTDRFVTIKMAQTKLVEVEEVDENDVVSTITSEYYHCVKFVIDTQENLVFMFYNDITFFDDSEETSKSKAVTFKKIAFHNLFVEGNRTSIIKYNISDYLNKYIISYLDKISGTEEEEDVIEKSIAVIETQDPLETRNNLRSSKRDFRHNKYRLQAIKYALQNEEHVVKIMECNINKRWIQFRNGGEIILNGPYFGMEVIESVCKEVFTDYQFDGYRQQGTATNT